MTWEELISSMLSGASNFVTNFVSMILAPLKPETIEGLSALFILGICIRLINGGARVARVPKKIYARIAKKKKEDDEYILVKRA